MSNASGGHKWGPRPSEEDDKDPVEEMLKKTGCIELHYAVQECMAEHRDWRKCQSAVSEFRKCIEENKRRNDTS